MDILLIIIISLFILSTLALIWARARKREVAALTSVIATVIIHVTFWVTCGSAPYGALLWLALIYELMTVIFIGIIMVNIEA